jgi:hypothetical protein
MSITWTIQSDSRADLGPSVIMQQNTASNSASDYVTGGYAVYPSSFGLGSIRALIPAGFSSSSSGAPGSAVWEAIKPSTLGPAATYPWYLKVLTASNMAETASNTNFAGGTQDWIAIGY